MSDAVHPDEAPRIWPFLLQVLAFSAALWGLAVFPLRAYWPTEATPAAAAGWGIALGNALVGCASLVWAFGRSHRDFLKVLFGGMGVRLLLMGLAFGLLVAWTELHLPGLTFSLFVFYVLFQVLEIRFLVVTLKHRRLPPAETFQDSQS